MHAEPGDWLVAKGTVVDAPDEVGQIVEVRGTNGGPPFLVRWTRDDREALVFPGPDAHVVPASEKEEGDARARKRIAELQEAITRRSSPAPRT
ncbi:MAG: DUF1918 domain-containing protein [Rhodococcus sp. (in: high G+C Gram-positive bacteria)]|uniref:DUF1918 domain-containing protein n=1 Tax=Rhodococcus sp. TaxID=1831 RepID=UPI003BB00290